MTTLARRGRFSLVVAAGVGGFGLLATGAQAGGFGVHEQSTTYLGSAFAGSAAGGDISSLFWNSAAAALLPGCNASASLTGILASGEVTADGGALLLANPAASTSADVGTDALVPASYLTCQLSDRLFAGVAVNSPFGLVTKPDDTNWVGSSIAVTSKLFSVNINPTLAYKLTPTLTLGAGLQIEYMKLRLRRGSFPAALPISGSRLYEADDWGFGATAGVLWQPAPGTSVGLGFRSAVDLEASGSYERNPGLAPGATAEATGNITLPEQVTLSFRQALGPQWTVLGTVEWQNWSRIGNVTATGAGCISVTGELGTCETLNLNYRDGWFYSLGAEYAYSPALTLRAGAAYETSPITDETRNILLPDTDRIWVSVGASYKYSERMTLDFGYSHIFFGDAPFCTEGGGTSSHCGSGGTVLLSGDADGSADIVSLGMRYKF